MAAGCVSLVLILSLQALTEHQAAAALQDASRGRGGRDSPREDRKRRRLLSVRGYDLSDKKPCLLKPRSPLGPG
ncbi:hypothetical protein KUCAC02_017040 [Chaenocephalus aceratus]|nr:hypothetical protein KUCAC02_017040 [Chaenocephalus aceratus]